MKQYTIVGLLVVALTVPVIQAMATTLTCTRANGTTFTCADNMCCNEKYDSEKRACAAKDGTCCGCRKYA